MPIEFRCGQCGKLLRTGDETAGKQAKCPSCGTVQPIPSALSSASQPAPFGGEGTTSPFAASAPPLPVSPGGEVNPYQSPATALLGPVESSYAPMAGTREIRPTRIDFADVIRSTWEIATTDTNRFLMCLAVVITCIALNWAAGFVQQMLIFGLQAAGLPVGALMVANLFLTLFGVIFQMWLGIGQTLYFVRTARGEETSFGLVFSGAPFLLRIILASILITLVGIGILILCAIPAAVAYSATQEPVVGIVAFVVVAIAPSLYLGLTYYQFQYLIIDCDLDVIGSLTTSKEITTGNRLTVFLLYILAAIAVAVSLLLCCVPVLFTGPFVILGTMVAYLKMSGQTTADVLLRHSSIAPMISPTEPLR